MRKKPEYPRPVVIKSNDDDTVQIKSVEPLNWWVGMAEPVVTLTIHGHNAGLTRPQIKAKGVNIVGSHTTDSANYLFVDIAIGPEAEPGFFDIVLTRGGNAVASHPYELMRRRPAVVPRGLSGHDTIYLAMTDRFAHADTTAPAVTTREKIDRRKPYGRHGGNLRGTAAHADYLHKMGASALWLTPVFTSDQDEQSYHGYATTDYYAIDPRLGTLADYKMLSASLAQWGIKLIMDIVVNHCGTRHTWLTDAPSSLWFNSWDWKPEPTNYRPGVAVDIHASEYDRRRTVEGWFDVSMADLNMADPLVRTYMAEAAIWWVETASLAGIRVDTFPYADAEGTRWWVKRLLREYPDLGIVGETWVGSTTLTAAWQEDVPLLMDFPLQEAMCRAFTEGFSYGAGALRLYDVIANDRAYADPNALMIFGDNHDTGRLLTRLGGDIGVLHLALTFLMTTRGIPQILYGTEVLMDGDSDRGHAEIRRDFPGGWATDKEDWFGVATSNDDTLLKGRDAERRETFRLMGKLAELRKKSKAIAHGRLIHFLPTDNVYVYFRIADGETIMTILNMSQKNVTLNIEKFAELTGETLSGVDILTGKKYRRVTRIKIDARKARVIEIGA